jgi:hypothetical protein
MRALLRVLSLRNAIFVLGNDGSEPRQPIGSHAKQAFEVYIAPPSRTAHRGGPQGFFHDEQILIRTGLQRFILGGLPL